MKAMLKKLAFFALILFITIPPLSATAQTDDRGFELIPNFDPNNVLSDSDIFDANEMTYSRLVAFLHSKGGLADVRTQDIDGTEKGTAEIIWEMSQMYQINPKYLLALLQKEQSLVENPTPSQSALDWAAGYGVCDTCAKNDPAISDFKGFANQVYYAARQMREKYYLSVLATGKTISGMGPGIPTIIDGITVTPTNIATASLYTYTPHIHGNMNLWNIWHRWFSKNYPDGTVVRGTPSGRIYWIRYGLKRPFASLAVASSFVDISKIVDASDADLAAYSDGDKISFPNYALLKDPSGSIWRIIGNERRHIVDMATFGKLSFNLDEVEDVIDADLAQYTIGEPITTKSMSPEGMLVQAPGVKAVWYAEAGTKRLIQSPAILSLYFSGMNVQKISASDLNTLTTSAPYGIRDGELVRTETDPAVYAIENGKKRPIPSADIFESMGWKWISVEIVPKSLLDGYDIGEPILIGPIPTQTASP
jgi:hypothetical protein